MNEVEKLFLTVLGMSATGSLVILAVLLARLALRKAPKAFSYALWAVALLRLLCPYTFKSPISLAPSIQVEAPRDGGEVQVYAGAPSINQTMYRQVDDYFTGIYERSELARLQEAGTSSAAPARKEAAAPSWSAVAAAVWLAGCAALLGYSALSLIKLRRRLEWAVPLAGERRVRLADHIPSPFVLGLFRPVIYLPSDLPEGERDYILLHERTHIRRRDHVTRALAWFAVAVHWFNPLVWLAFHLAGRDMEMSCDEAVLRKMGREIRADYSTSLLRLSQGGRLPAGPLAFGGGDPQNRIKNILNYKKPAFWVAVLALAGVCVVGVALATDYAPARLIDPDSIVSYTAVNSTSQTITERRTIVSTPEDRQKDLADPSKQRPLSKERGDELVRLVNAYGKSVYGKGGLTLSGNEHHLVRMDRADGGYYLLDYWYWNGFCFNPFHGHGEDSYTTLVTHYGPDGKAGTTWQMECDFDRAYKDWLSAAEPPFGLSCSYNEDGSRVVLTGSRAEGMNWFIAGQSEFAPLGILSFGGLKLSNGWEVIGGACWTSEDRNAIQMNLIGAPVSLTYTVVVGGSTERIIIQREVGGVIGENKEEDLHLPDGEVIELAEYFVQCIQAAEAFHANGQPADSTGADLSYEIGQTDGGPFVRITGKVYGQTLERNAVWSSSGMEELYGGHASGLSMRYTFASGGAELMAWWTDEEHKTVALSTQMSALLSSYMPCGWWEFTVDLSGEQGRVTAMEARGGDSALPDPVKMYPESITNQEAVFAARVAAKLLTAAEDFYNNYDGPAPSPSAQPSPKPSAAPAPSAEPTPKPSPTPAPALTPEPSAAPAPPPEALEGFIWHPWGFFRGNSMRWEIAPAPSNGSHIRCTYANEVGLPVVLLLCRKDTDTGIVPDIVSQLTVPAGETRSMVYDIPEDQFGEYYVHLEENQEGRHLQGYIAVTQF